MAKKKPVKKELWVIEFRSPDPRMEFTTAYHSRKEAIEAAVSFIEYNAKNDLEGIGWGNEEEVDDIGVEPAPKLLKEALNAIKEKRFDDAVYAWLEYQNEYDPQDQMAIGPSGAVSDSSSDFRSTY